MDKLASFLDADVVVKVSGTLDAGLGNCLQFVACSITAYRGPVSLRAGRRLACPRECVLLDDDGPQT